MLDTSGKFSQTFVLNFISIRIRVLATLKLIFSK